MRKSLIVISASLIFTLVFLVGIVAAINNTGLENYDSRIELHKISADTWEQAEMFKDLGLFLGTDKGFELNRKLNRAEAATLLVRFMGEEASALVEKNKHPFTDVPAWADPYVGWLYKEKLTLGIGGNRYGSDLDTSYWQFATFLSRITSGHDDFLASGTGNEREEKLIDGLSANSADSGFRRGDAVNMLARFMQNLYFRASDDSSITMTEFLVKQGVFTGQDLGEAAHDVFSLYYNRTEDGRISASINGQEIARSEVVAQLTSENYKYKKAKDLFVYQLLDDDYKIYQLDPISLQGEEIGCIAVDSANLYWDILADIEYVEQKGNKLLIIKDVLGEGILVSVEAGLGSLMDQGLLKKTNSGQGGTYYYRDQDILMTILANRVHLWKETGHETYNLENNQNYVAAADGIMVTIRENLGEGYVEALKLDDGSLISSHLIENSEGGKLVLSEYGLMDLLHTIDYRDESDSIFKLYGKAGLYFIAEGKFSQVSERSVLDLVEVEGQREKIYALLTHEAAGPYQGQEIYKLESDYSKNDQPYQTNLLLAKLPDDSLLISSLYSKNGEVGFYSMRAVGMANYDVYTYKLLPDELGHNYLIKVIAFEPGRPEISFYDKDEAYYIAEEQARLDELRYWE